MFLSDISIKRPIMMSMLLIVFLLFGAIAFMGMSLDLIPNVDIPYVTIQTVYPGAGPKEVETQITKKIEDEISSVGGIKKITSYSMEGLSLINIEFNLNKDVDIANQEVKDKVDAILNDLPDDADLPLVEKYNIQEKPIIDIVLSGDMPITELWDLADKTLSDRFSQIPGVARADITGGQEREIQVILDDRAVFQNNISLEQLSQVLAAHNLELPSGYFQSTPQEYTVRIKGEYENIEELSELEIPTAFGNKKLSDIAEVRDAGADVRERSTYFDNIKKISNSNVVLISLVKNSEGNTVDIARSVYEKLPEIRKILPAGCNLEVVNDKSIFIESTVSDTISNIVLGIILTGLVLLFFLQDIRSTIIVALAMPMSILSAFFLMNLMGFTKNMMTLMGLSTSVGILVSNSVVVIENIFRQRRKGKNRTEAASTGTSQVVVAVLAATATNIAVFLPVANMSSIVGMFFKSFALTVTFATLFSLLISFTLTPMMASLILPENDSNKKRKISDKIEGWIKKLETGYRYLIEKVLHSKKSAGAVLLVGIVLLAGTFLMSDGVGFEFMSILDEGDIDIEVELPIGYDLDETADVLQDIENRLKEEPSVEHILTQVGKISDIDQGTYLALMKVKLVKADRRKLTTVETANKFISELSDIPNAMLRIRAVSSLGRGGAEIEYNLKGQDVDELEKLKNIIVDRIKDVPGLVNLNTSSRSGKPEISIIPDRKKITDAGLTIYDIAMQLRGALTGLVATRYRDKGEEYDIRVMVDDAAIDSPEEVANLTITGKGKTYTISQLAEVKFSEGVNKIMHLDKYKSIQITGSSSADVPLGDVTSEIESRTADIVLPSGYSLEWGGDAEMMKEAVVDMASTLFLAIILTYMLLAAILENLTQPLLVLGTFPLAMIGVIGSILLTGTTINIISMMAVIMLLGIVVNNAILILDNFNVLVHEEGREFKSALIEACESKLRPILMSSIAIILGMLPMALGMGEAGREMRQPMGIVTIGGLVVSTVLTLYVIPALMYLTSGKKKTATATKTESKGE